MAHGEPPRSLTPLVCVCEPCFGWGCLTRKGGRDSSLDVTVLLLQCPSRVFLWEQTSIATCAFGTAFGSSLLRVRTFSGSDLSTGCYQIDLGFVGSDLATIW